MIIQNKLNYKLINQIQTIKDFQLNLKLQENILCNQFLKFIKIVEYYKFKINKISVFIKISHFKYDQRNLIYFLV